MPKQTFFNLPDQKREQFTEIALKEFALHDYSSASISKIIREMGIAKGSLYQYFGNKRELYFYLVDVATEKKLKSAEQLYDHAGDLDFFKWFRKNQLQSLLFDLAHPVEGLLLQNIHREVHNEEVGELALQSKKESISYYKNVLKQHYLAGGLGTKPNYIALAFVLVQTGNGLMDLLQMQFDFSLREHAKTNTPVEVDELEVKKIIKKIVKSIQLNFA